MNVSEARARGIAETVRGGSKRPELQLDNSQTIMEKPWSLRGIYKVLLLNCAPLLERRDAKGQGSNPSVALATWGMTTVQQIDLIYRAVAESVVLRPLAALRVTDYSAVW